MLNERQIRIYNFIKEYILENSYPPSVRDIKEGANVGSTSTVSLDLNKLEELNYIKKSNLKSRSIEIVDRNVNEQNESYFYNEHKIETIDVPLLGNVAAGSPIMAIENVEDFYPISSAYSKYGELFMLTISGDSMIDIGILDGDRILVSKTQDVKHNDIVIALIDDGATCKRLYKKNGQVMLIPENSTMEPIIPDNLIILGKVISLYRDRI